MGPRLSRVVSVAWHGLRFQDVFLDPDVLLAYCCVWFPLILCVNLLFLVWLFFYYFFFLLYLLIYLYIFIVFYFCIIIFIYLLFFVFINLFYLFIVFIACMWRVSSVKTKRIRVTVVRDVTIYRHICACVSWCTDKARNKELNSPKKKKKVCETESPRLTKNFLSDK